MNIIVKLEPKLPQDFRITFNELKDWHYGKFKPNSKSSKSGLTLKIRSWKGAEIIYEDNNIIAGRFKIDAIMKDNSKAKIPFDFMIGKLIFEKTKHRIRAKTLSLYYNQLEEKQISSINKKTVDTLMPECFEKLKQYKSFLEQKNIKS